jgi:mannose-6-phosphate isomerase-like protein (cupin superfamily)
MATSDAFEVDAVRRRLEAGSGGYEVVHASPGLELGVYVLVAPEPDRQQPHADDEVYVVLEGRGVLTLEGEPIPVETGRPCSCRPAPTTGSRHTRA